MNEIYLIESAQDILTRTCMKKRGYDWEVIDHRKLYPDLRNRRRYGVIEMPVAKEMGYKSNARLMGSTDITARKTDREKRLGAAERQAALNPADGCYAQAGAQLASGNRVDEDLVNKLNSASLDQALKSPAGARATRSWARCMRQEGHPYQDFYRAAEDPRWARSHAPSPGEKQTAQADVTCKQRVGLVKSLSEEERAVQERDIRDHKGYFAHLRSAKDRQLDAARAVLGRR
ncbi:hypothetical protein [Streptomyces sp. HUAS TT20]|uniref:hypothetical protein n=1 Tax=Streptomyces sp. HUAS TT20 TaxID=3447509 RepID=UPI0021DB2BC1|nr:hypothetical protein [Streptomyces sp. HUAS 15-9]UXY27289.1 hypothetical protein N8I87_12275 [Streptomyces sp. HUAS 15-9]